MTRTRETYEADYRAARLAGRSADTLAERDEHFDAARRIARRADRAGFYLDEIELDEQARRAMLEG